MADEEAEALAAFRASNYEHIYLRPSSVAQGRSVVSVLRALVEYFGDRPNLIPRPGGRPPISRRGARGHPRRGGLCGRNDRQVRLQPGRGPGRVGIPDKLPVGVGSATRV